MKLRHGLGIFAILSLALVGCTGDQGPAGPPGPEGPEGPEGPPGESFSEFAYQGGFGEACLHCHGANVDEVLTTKHTNAFLDLGDSQTNLYCVACHTTGFNCDVNFGDTEVDPANCWEPSDGYSGYVGDTTEEGMARAMSLEGVQCEACHGAMGPNFNAHRPDVSFSTNTDIAAGTSESLCFACHEGQIEEWVESGHAMAEGGDPEALGDHFGRTSCDFCHTSEGFIRTQDPVFANYDFGGEYSQVGCPTCHDPHVGDMGSGNEAQLRSVAASELSYTFPWDAGDDEAPRMEGYGVGQTCAQCHKARRNNSNVAGQIANGYGHFGPHGSPQADMFIGYGSYEIPGYTYNRVQAHQSAVATGCVECHMVREVVLHGDLQDHAFHTFEANPDNCLPCHTITDFDYNGVQTTIQGKLDAVAVEMGYADWATLLLTLDDDNLLWTVCEREAVYGAVFVSNSGDMGVHNSSYANSLLDNGLDYLQTVCHAP
jgi:hypothetical protein